MWVVLIGADADTYGAVAGALLAAYHSTVGEGFLEGLQVKREIEECFEKLRKIC